MDLIEALAAQDGEANPGCRCTRARIKEWCRRGATEERRAASSVVHHTQVAFAADARRLAEALQGR